MFKRINVGLAALMLVLAPGGWMAAEEPGQSEQRLRIDADISVEDILDRIEYFSRIDDEKASQWHAGLQHMSSTAARLEQALLEIYGPESVRDPVRGLERIEQFHEGAWPDGITQLLEVLGAHVGAQLRLQAEREELAGQLERKRQAHDEALEKLEALRQIERQLETQLTEEEPDDSRFRPQEGGRR